MPPGVVQPEAVNQPRDHHGDVIAVTSPHHLNTALLLVASINLYFYEFFNSALRYNSFDCTLLAVK